MNLNKKELHLFQAKEDDFKNMHFDSGDADLNEFILKDSIVHLENNLCIIFLCLYEQDVVGYFSLSADSIKVNEELVIRYPLYPSLKIGRLAIDKKYQGQGIGTYIIDYIIFYARFIQELLGVRFLSVDSYNNKHTLNFYSRNNFKKFKKNNYQHTVPMYLDLNISKLKKE